MKVRYTITKTYEADFDELKKDEILLGYAEQDELPIDEWVEEFSEDLKEYFVEQIANEDDYRHAHYRGQTLEVNIVQGE